MPGTRLKTMIVGVALAAVVAAGTAWAGGTAQPAHAPGKNGRILFDRHDTSVSDDTDLMFMSATGTGDADVPEIGNNGINEFDPQISPNGKLIVFWRNDGGDGDIFTIRANGTGLDNLTEDSPGFDGLPAFSPNGRKIVYQSVAGIDGDIFTMNANGSGKDDLTDNDTAETEPAWSPNGKLIAYTSFGADNTIHLMNANGSNQHQASAPGVDAQDPSFFPSGKRILFDLVEGAQFDVGSMKLDGSDVQNLTVDNPGSNDLDGAVSPNGKRFVFVSRREGGDTDRDVWIASFSDLDGATNLTSDGASGIDDEAPVWEFVYRCGGKRATIVGSSANEKIRGTRKKDVIVGNAGKDRIRGGGGRDRICGGKGRDRLIGGPGRDLLKGGPGKDRQRQ